MIIHCLVMLQWFVSISSTNAALMGTSEDIKCINEISSACIDENLNINRIKQYFTDDSWLVLLEKVSKFMEIGWLCRICKESLNGNQIGCDSCLEWQHFDCIGIKKAPKAKTWFCRYCYSNI